MLATPMNSDIDPNNAPATARHRLLQKVAPVIALFFTIAITVSIYVTYGRYPERLTEFQSYTYLGAFIISLLGNATIVLPAAVLVILTNMGIVLYMSVGIAGPVMIGIAGGLGAGIGELTGYIAGYSGRTVILGNKRYARIQGWLTRWGSMTIFILSIMPLFFDLVGIAAGTLRFPLWKFIVVCTIGRIILYTGLILGAALGWKTVLPYFG
jgi:membrane protein DedA with SNARE-associated domain